MLYLPEESGAVLDVGELPAELPQCKANFTHVFYGREFEVVQSLFGELVSVVLWH